MSTSGKHKRNEFARLSVAGLPGFCAEPKCMRKCKAAEHDEDNHPGKCHEGQCWPSQEAEQ